MEVSSLILSGSNRTERADPKDADAILGRLFLSPCYSGDDVINMLQRIRDEDVSFCLPLGCSVF
jgi:hypothetical protein